MRSTIRGCGDTAAGQGSRVMAVLPRGHPQTDNEVSPMIEMKYSLYVLDMDGTFYLGDKPIPGALEFIARVRESGAEFLFLTNNSSKTSDQYVAKLGQMGLATDRQHVLTSADATITLLLRETPYRRLFLMAPPSVKEEFTAAGFNLDEESPEALVLAFDTTLEYGRLARFCHLVREGRPFIATHPDINCPTPAGPIPDVGAMLDLIASSTGRRPDQIVGKPSPDFLRAAMLRFGTSPEETVMIGDRIYTDVLCGLRAGTGTVLVLSGESTLETLERSRDKPALVVGSVAEIRPLQARP